MLTAIFGSIPSIAWTAFAYFRVNWTGIFAALFALLCFVIPFVMVATAAGLVGGLFAHWWFAESTISVRGASIATALLADAILFAWVVVLSL